MKPVRDKICDGQADDIEVYIYLRKERIPLAIKSQTSQKVERDIYHNIGEMVYFHIWSATFAIYGEFIP